MYIHVYMYVYMCTLYIRIYVYVYMCIYVYMYICIYVYRDATNSKTEAVCLKLLSGQERRRGGALRLRGQIRRLCPCARVPHV